MKKKTSAPAAAALGLLLLFLNVLHAHAESGSDERGAGVSFQSSTRTPYPFRPGRADFIQYWSAFQLLRDGRNPYDAQLLHEVQIGAGEDPERTVSLWNPPWTVLLLSPILQLPLDSAASVWAVINGILIGLIAILLSTMDGAPKRRSVMIFGVLVLSFYPVIETVWWGQTSLVLAAALVGSFWLMVRGRDGRAGMVLALLSLKPHLFLAFGVGFLVWAATRRRIRLLLSAGGSLGLLLVITHLLWPHALEWWWASLGTQPDAPGSVSILHWKTATVAGAVRLLIFNLTGTAPVWPMWALPLLSCSAVFFWSWTNRSRIDLGEHLPVLLCVSLLGSPYGWRCDQSVLVLVHGLLLGRSTADRRPIGSLLGISHGALFALSLIPGATPHLFFWFPALSLLLWTGRTEGASPNASARRTPAPAVARRRRLPAIFAVQCIIGIAAAEFMVRLMHTAPDVSRSFRYVQNDPSAPWKPAPSSVQIGGYGPGEYQFTHSHNTLGFRDREHAEHAPPRTIRLLLVGDSFVYGAGAAQDETYAAVLERSLQDMTTLGDGAPACDIEVLNLGIPRYFALTERMLLEGYAKRFGPDLVLVHFVANDIVDSVEGIDAVTLDPEGEITTREAAQLGRIGRVAFIHSHLFRLLWANMIARRPVIQRYRDWPNFLRENGPYENGWTETEREYSLMTAAVSNIGGRLVLVNLASKESWTPQGGYPGERLSRLSSKLGIPFIDTAAALRSQPMGPLFWQRDTHPNAAGYRALADSVAQSLAASDLLRSAREKRCP